MQVMFTYFTLGLPTRCPVSNKIVPCFALRPLPQGKIKGTQNIQFLQEPLNFSPKLLKSALNQTLKTIRMFCTDYVNLQPTLCVISYNAYCISHPHSINIDIINFNSHLMQDVHKHNLSSIMGAHPPPSGLLKFSLKFHNHYCKPISKSVDLN